MKITRRRFVAAGLRLALAARLLGHLPELSWEEPAQPDPFDAVLSWLAQVEAEVLPPDTIIVHSKVYEQMKAVGLL